MLPTPHGWSLVAISVSFLVACGEVVTEDGSGGGGSTSSTSIGGASASGGSGGQGLPCGETNLSVDYHATDEATESCRGIDTLEPENYEGDDLVGYEEAMGSFRTRTDVRVVFDFDTAFNSDASLVITTSGERATVTQWVQCDQSPPQSTSSSAVLKPPAFFDACLAVTTVAERIVCIRTSYDLDGLTPTCVDTER